MGCRRRNARTRCFAFAATVIASVLAAAPRAPAAESPPTTPLASLSIPRPICCTSGVQTPSGAYLFGGQWSYGRANGGIMTAEIYRYDRPTNSFTVAGSLPIARAYTAAAFDSKQPLTDISSGACASGCAYVFGGATKGSCTSDSAHYMDRDACGFVVDFPPTDSTFLSISAWNASSEIDRFDPATGVATASGYALPDAWAGQAAVWDGEATATVPTDAGSKLCVHGCAYIFGGARPGGIFSDAIHQFDPDEGIHTLPIKLPSPRAYASAIWSPPVGIADLGGACINGCAYIFGGMTLDAEGSPVPTDQIVRFDPTTGTAVALEGVHLPGARAYTAAFWSGFGINQLCLLGCAYILGGMAPNGLFEDDVVRFDPKAGTVVATKTLRATVAGAVALWDPGTERTLTCPKGCAYLFGGDVYPSRDDRFVGPYSNRALRLVLDDALVLTGIDVSDVLPLPRCCSAAGGDGQSAWIFAGHQRDCTYSDRVVSYVPSNPVEGIDRPPGLATFLPGSLQSCLGYAASASDGISTYLFGGASDGDTPTNTIIRYVPVGYSLTGQAQITLAETSTGEQPSGTSLSISQPAPARGNVLIAQVTHTGGAPVAITPPAGWTLIRRDDNGTTVGQAVYYRVDDTTVLAGESVEWSFSTVTGEPTTVSASGGIASFAGVDPGPLAALGMGQSVTVGERTVPLTLPGTGRSINAHAGATGEGSSIRLPSALLPQNGSVLVSLAGQTSTDAALTGADFPGAVLWNSPAAQGQPTLHGASWKRFGTAQTAGGDAIGSSGAGPWVAQVIGLAPAASTYGAAATMQTKLPWALAGAAAVWDPWFTPDCPEGCAYIFGGFSDDDPSWPHRARGEIFRYRPDQDAGGVPVAAPIRCEESPDLADGWTQTTALQVVGCLPTIRMMGERPWIGRSHLSAVWADASVGIQHEPEEPAAGCALGCAYVFGGRYTTQIVRFDPHELDLRRTRGSGTPQIAAGEAHTLLLDAGGAVWAWGDDSAGQLGDGTRGSAGCSCRGTPVRAGVLPPLAQLAAGEAHSLALAADGGVWAFGANASGEAGAAAAGTASVPVQVCASIQADRCVPLSGVAEVAAGAGFSLARTSDGAVLAWGANEHGQLGDGTMSSRAIPARVPGLPEVVAISAGKDHSLALDSAGRVWAWGNNASGALGNGGVASSAVPVQVCAPSGCGEALSGIKAISAGAGFSIALDEAGKALSWGAHEAGQLGNGTAADALVPTRVCARGAGASCEPQGDLSAIAAGGRHSLALGQGGNVLAWGANENGQLGVPLTMTCGSVLCSTAPVAPGVMGASAVSAGSRFSLALVGGVLWVWGDNSSGQLGVSAAPNVPRPTKASREIRGETVIGITGLAAVSAGGDHTLMEKF